MRYLCLIKSSENAQVGAPPQELYAGIEKLGVEARAAGVLLEIGGLVPTVAGPRLRLPGGRLRGAAGAVTRGGGEGGGGGGLDGARMGEGGGGGVWRA